ncbi:MAG: hypothetical protein KR126chlam6_00432 [Candidatus Anoxychlamydiales bacterium]|nr:hypothetical protein [Candidatus Anoxychlamydiales bacterium]
MGHSAKVTRGKGLEISDSDESLLSPKAHAPEIVWKTHKYCTQEAPEKGIFCSSKKPITTPLTDRATWKKNTKSAIVFIAGMPTVKTVEVDRIVEKLKKEGLKTTTVAERIFEVASLYTKKSKYKFLKDFTDIYDAKDFLQKLDTLDEKQKILLKRIIGGYEAFKIIQDFNDDKKLSKIVKKIKSRLSEIAKRKKSIEESVIEVTKGPKQAVQKDGKTVYAKGGIVVYERALIKKYYEDKISSLNIAQIKLSFRSFFSKKVFGKNGFLHINDEDIALPYLLRIPKSKKAERILLLDPAKLPKKGDSTRHNSIIDLLKKLSDKSTSVNDIIISDIDLVNLTKEISSAKGADISINDILTPFDDIKAEQDVFYIWLQNKLCEKLLVGKKTEEDPNTIDFILKSLSIEMFGAAHTTLLYKFPSVFEAMHDSPRWKYNPANGSKYSINYDEESNIEITQLKKCPLIDPSGVVLGNMDVIYQIKANQECELLSAKILLKNIEFTDEADLFTQIDVLRKMEIKKPSKRSSSKKERRS